MDADEASISWIIGHEKHEKIVMLRNSKLLLSRYFLQCLIPPTYKFISLKAIIQVGSEILHVSIPLEWDIEGNEYYVLDSTLSTRYEMEHSSVLMYISDSEDSESNQNIELAKNNMQESHPKVISKSINQDEDPVALGKDTTIDLQSSDEEMQQKQTKSIISWISENQKCSRLQNMVNSSREVKQVKEIPQQYDGNLVFELPPVFDSSKRMEGMEQRFDGHL